MTHTLDLFIIGGGINGAGIAADAAGRGLNVALCEQNDLASATSSASSKLIHGGLRYLENYEFHLVYKALQERDCLLNAAPHLIQPLRFVIPHNQLMRHTALVQLGLFLYNYLGGRSKLPRSKKLSLQSSEEGVALKSQFDKGFTYYDCMVDDSRLVVTNAISAHLNGACIHTHTKFLNATRHRDYWDIEAISKQGKRIHLQARAIVNAAGPWVNELQNKFEYHTPKPLRLVKGSHILVPKLYDGDFAYVLQNADNRIVFVIPFHGRYSLIGTTEEDFQGDPADVSINQNEKMYLCQSINNYFKTTLDPNEIIWHYSGTRPLLYDPTKEMSNSSREYQITVESSHTTAPLVTVFGGKITTYRLLAEEVLNQLKHFFPKLGPSWTARSKLPGGDLTSDTFVTFVSQLQIQYPWLSLNLATRYAKSYGTRCHLFLKGIQSLDDLGTHYGSGLYQKEIDYLIDHEWVNSSDDILWRRSKLGLYLSPSQQNHLRESLK